MKWMKTVLCNEVLVVLRWVVILNGIHINTLGTGYLNCLYAYKRKSASPVLNVLKCKVYVKPFKTVSLHYILL
jgi:hypothetical protein